MLPVSQDDVTTPSADTGTTGGGGHPVLVYTGLRLLLLAVTAGVLWLIGLRQPLILLVFAFLISGVISVFALNRRREVAAVEVVSAVQKVNQRIDASASAEDAPDDDLEPLTGEVAAPSGATGADPAAGGFPGANGTSGRSDPTADGAQAPAQAPAVKPTTARDIPADDDLDDLDPDDLDPTDRP